MKHLRRVTLWLALAGIIILTGLSVVGAFMGAERAGHMFGSIPLVAFWILFVVLLAAGFLLFRRLLRSPGLLAAHLGVLLVLLGAMRGSERAHRLAQRFFGSRKIASGYLVIGEGQASNTVLGDPSDSESLRGMLPFSLHLKDFRIE